MSQQDPKSDHKDDLTALRAHLFDAIRGVRAGTLDVEKARTINEIGKTLCDTARVEVDYLRATGGGESQFLDTTIGAANVKGALPNGITGITRHRLQG